MSLSEKLYKYNKVFFEMIKKIASEDIESLYDRISGEDFEGDDEKNRWSGKTEKSRYRMMRSSINKLSRTAKYSRFIELGPGPGTWTKLFLNRNKHLLRNLFSYRDYYRAIDATETEASNRPRPFQEKRFCSRRSQGNLPVFGVEDI